MYISCLAATQQVVGAVSRDGALFYGLKNPPWQCRPIECWFSCLLLKSRRILLTCSRNGSLGVFFSKNWVIFRFLCFPWTSWGQGSCTSQLRGTLTFESVFFEWQILHWISVNRLRHCLKQSKLWHHFDTDFVAQENSIQSYSYCRVPLSREVQLPWRGVQRLI